MTKIRRNRRVKRKNKPLLALIIVLVVAVAVLGVVLAMLWNPSVVNDETTDPTTEPTTTTTTVPNKIMVVTATELNVRTGPGMEYEVLGTLTQGTQVEVLALEGDWFRILYQDTEAYVSADYLVERGFYTTTTTTKPTTTTSATKGVASTTTTTTKPTGTSTSPKYSDRYIDENGMLQFDAANNYVQLGQYGSYDAIPWNLLLVNDWNPMRVGYDTKVKMANISGNAGTKQVDARILTDLKKMLEAGKAYNIGVQSAYRPYETQERLYWAQVDRAKTRYKDPVEIQTKAGEVVKRPGFSEHNTGLAVDLYGSGDYSLTESFASTKAYDWLIENCADYGFILRFPKGKEAITGVIYEAWHFRYVGDPEIAHEIMDNGLCLEEYLANSAKGNSAQ